MMTRESSFPSLWICLSCLRFHRVL
jgi:hypothetical protein